jgi:Na+/H+-dicarboxylate symporter
MLRLLKMLVLPLVAVSMVSGVCALQQSGGGVGRLARLTFLYYTGRWLPKGPPLGSWGAWAG